jgi:hypothetical protein
LDFTQLPFRGGEAPEPHGLERSLVGGTKIHFTLQRHDLIVRAVGPVRYTRTGRTRGL